MGLLVLHSPHLLSSLREKLLRKVLLFDTKTNVWPYGARLWLQGISWWCWVTRERVIIGRNDGNKDQSTVIPPLIWSRDVENIIPPRSNVKSKLFRFFVFSFHAEAVFKRTRLTLFYALPFLSPVPLQTHLPFLGTVSEKYFWEPPPPLVSTGFPFPQRTSCIARGASQSGA